MKEHKHAEVLRAIADGKKYQYRTCIGEWIDAWDANPINESSWEWRIKPEPKPVIIKEMHIAVYDNELSTCDWMTSVPVRIVLDGDTRKPISVELVK